LPTVLNHIGQPRFQKSQPRFGAIGLDQLLDDFLARYPRERKPLVEGDPAHRIQVRNAGKVLRFPFVEPFDEFPKFRELSEELPEAGNFDSQIERTQKSRLVELRVRTVDRDARHLDKPSEAGSHLLICDPQRFNIE